MMTKEEIAEIVAYCEEKKISYKQRLVELGINAWSFYDAKRRYAPKQKNAEQNVVSVSIELRTPTGTMMRINGNLTGRELKDIIIASSTYVYMSFKPICTNNCDFSCK